jgi:hypothetical protein
MMFDIVCFEKGLLCVLWLRGKTYDVALLKIGFAKPVMGAKK